MRQLVVTACALVVLAACGTDRTTSVLPPSSGASPTQNAPDLVGLPDLIVDSKATQNNWVTRVEDFPAEFCSVQEGGVTAGTHKVIRFTVTTPNVGDADVFVGSPLKHMVLNNDRDFT